MSNCISVVLVTKTKYLFKVYFIENYTSIEVLNQALRLQMKNPASLEREVEFQGMSFLGE